MTLQPPPETNPPQAFAPPPAAAPTPPPVPAQAVNENLDQPRTEEVPHGVWQHPFVVNVLPFLTSLLLHIGIIVVGILTMKVVTIVRDEINKEQIIIPDAAMVESGPEGGLPHPGLGTDPTRDAAQDQFPEVPKDTRGMAERPGTNLLPSLMGGGGGEEQVAGVIGIGPGGLGKGFGTGAGIGPGMGTGEGDGSGQLAPFGAPGGGGGIGIKASFIGMGGSARKIAYVCDASGSMLNMFDSLRVELRRSIEQLKPVQSFAVVFFQDNGFGTVDKNGLIMANAENKRRSYDFLDKFFVRGETNPIPALEFAFKQQPELIFLLTDGDFAGPGNEAVVTFCKQKTSDGKTKINTIAFINKDTKEHPADLEFVKVLQAIAKNSGGTFKTVSDDDMAR